MKSVQLWTMIAALGLATVFPAAALQAGNTAPDTIEMKAPYKHEKGIVEFSHRQHTAEYENARGERITCGECHHDENGEPLALKEGDDVQKCFDCHDKPGQLKGKAAKEKPESEVIEYHANALHGNCIDCHNAYNRANKTKAAPQTCTKCHPKQR